MPKSTKGKALLPAERFNAPDVAQTKGRIAIEKHVWVEDVEKHPPLAQADANPSRRSALGMLLRTRTSSSMPATADSWFTMVFVFGAMATIIARARR